MLLFCIAITNCYCRKVQLVVVNGSKTSHVGACRHLCFFWGGNYGIGAGWEQQFSDRSLTVI